MGRVGGPGKPTLDKFLISLVFSGSPSTFMHKICSETDKQSLIALLSSNVISLEWMAGSFILFGVMEDLLMDELVPSPPENQCSPCVSI